MCTVHIGSKSHIQIRLNNELVEFYQIPSIYAPICAAICKRITVLWVEARGNKDDHVYNSMQSMSIFFSLLFSIRSLLFTFMHLGFGFPINYGSVLVEAHRAHTFYTCFPKAVIWFCLPAFHFPISLGLTHLTKFGLVRSVWNSRANYVSCISVNLMQSPHLMLASFFFAYLTRYFGCRPKIFSAI